MLTVTDLSFSPAGTLILDHLDLSVAEGEMVTLLGPSGSGKTTLLRMVAGLDTPDQGRVELEDQVLTEGHQVKVPASKRPFAYLFQDFTLFPHLTVRQNIALGIRKLPNPERRDRVEAMAGLLGITPLLKRRIHRLSGGEQQRVALARTLVMRPRLLMLDEPFSNLDPMTQQRLSRDVKGIARELGIAVLLASHNREEAFYFSDRLVVLSKGRKRAEGPPAHLYRNPGSEWLATFTGETVLCSSEQLGLRFDHSPQKAADLYLVRPEDIELIPIKGQRESVVRTDAEKSENLPGVCSVSGVEFYGTTSKVYVKDVSGDAFHAAVLGPTPFQVGDAVALRLVRDPVPLTA